MANALSSYCAQLTSEDNFASWTMEDFVCKLRSFSKAKWIDMFNDRYLAFDKIDRRLGSSEQRGDRP